MTSQQDLLTHLIFGTATQSHFEAVFITYSEITDFLDKHSDILESFDINTRESFSERNEYWITDAYAKFEYTLTRGDINFVPLPQDVTYTVTRSPEL